MTNLITFKQTGSLEKTIKYLNQDYTFKILNVLERYARQGVAALSSATPTDSGLTASSWGYEIHRNRGSFSIVWTNSHTVDGIPVAILIQYGHATKNGGYVEGRDFINPAMRSIFDKIAEDSWKEVNNI